MKHSIQSRIFLLFGGAVLAIGLALMLSQYWKGAFGVMPPCFEIREPEHHRYRPNCAGFFAAAPSLSVKYEINSEGLRERPLSQLPEGPRILFLGDSNIEGHGLEFPETIGQKVERALGSVATVNAGLRFTGPLMQYQLLQKYYPLIKPKIVVWSLCENDANDDQLFQALGKKFSSEGFPYEFSTEDFQTGSPRALRPIGISGLDEVLGVLRFRYYQWHTKKIADRVQLSELKSCAALEKAYAFLRKNEVQVLFTILPLGPNNKALQAERDFSATIAKCLPTEATVIDLREEMKSRIDLFLPSDTHPNSAGAAFVAEKIAAKLSPLTKK